MATNDPERNRRYQREFRERMSPEEKKKFDKERYQRNKEAHNRNSREWAKKNPHKIQASVHQSSVKNNYPVKWEQSDIVKADLASWLLDQKGGECPYCGEPTTSIDHVVPLSRGGSHTWENIELLCTSCSQSKKGKTKEEFIELTRRVVEKLSKRLPVNSD